MTSPSSNFAFSSVVLPPGQASTIRLLRRIGLLLLVARGSLATSVQPKAQVGLGIHIGSQDRFFVATSHTPGNAEVVARGELALDKTLTMTFTPLDRANSGLGEGKFWNTIADETQDSARTLKIIFTRLESMIDQAKTFSECYITTPLQLSAARRELVSSATKAAFGCTDGGAHVVHEVYAAADALRIHPAEVEERPAAFVSPNGATYLLGEYAAMFTLLDIIPPPFDMQQTSKHGTPHILVFLQDNPSSESLDETFGAKHVPIRWEHVDIIARGAAILASYSLFQEPVTILPLALNIVLHGSYSHTLVPRFSTLPRRVDVTLTTVHDSQRSATIELREGSRPCARDNLPLARLVLGDLVPTPAGMLRIDVTVVIDKYLSAIELEAVESKSAVRAKQVVERGVVLYEDGVLEAQQEAEEDHRSADNFLREHFDWTSAGNQYHDAVRLFHKRDEHDEL